MGLAPSRAALCSTWGLRPRVLSGWEPWSQRRAYATWQVPSLADPDLPPPDTWRQRLQQLQDFVVQQGRLPRSHGGTAGAPLAEQERGLGVWCSTQRQRWKGNKQFRALSPAQVAALEATPCWQWDPRAEEWEQRFQEVSAFVQRCGRLPRQSGGQEQPLQEGEQVLGMWCNSQRQRRKGHGNMAPLAPEQAAKLEGIPGWQWDPFAEDWEQRWQQVAAFVQRYGRLPRRSGSQEQPLREGEQVLGQWCSVQRQRRKGQGTCSPLAPEQAAKLEGIPGWQWDTFAEDWEQRWQQVAAFVQRYGRLPRRSGGKEQPLREGEQVLGMWCAIQRQRRKGQGNRAPLAPEQAAQLEGIPGWQWDPYAEDWEQRWQQVAAFVQRYGRLPRLSGGQEQPLREGEQVLGRWCNKQRQRRKGQGNRAPLTPEQAAQLEGIPGWQWDPYAEDWEQRWQQVAAFVQWYGRLPRCNGGKEQPLVEMEQVLWRWCSTQQQRRKGNSGAALSLEQAAKLEAVPGWRW